MKPAHSHGPGDDVAFPHGWTDWQRLDELPAISADVLAEILDGGQAFRWHRLSAGGKRQKAETAEIGKPAPAGRPASDSAAENPPATWLGTWSDHVVQVRLGPNERLEWSAPALIAPRAATALAKYFGVDRDFAGLSDLLPWRSDPHLARCIVAFHGLRILEQPFGETLLGFLCSATKQIVQIKQMIALLAARHGEPILVARAIASPANAQRADISAGGSDRDPADAGAARSRSQPRQAAGERANVSAPDGSHHRLPTWPELARIPEGELRKCRLGFRARYISETARFLAAHPGWLEETEALPYSEAKQRLCSLPGVGEKVADCVLLFGASRLEAFPVDVWILKTMARRYGLDGWKPAQLVQFGRLHFGPLAGLAQQYLFAWERRHGRTQA